MTPTCLTDGGFVFLFSNRAGNFSSLSPLRDGIIPFPKSLYAVMNISYALIACCMRKLLTSFP